MNLQGVWNWAVDNVLVWIIFAFAGWPLIDAIKNQKVGQGVFALVIGAAGYYFVKQPEQVMNAISNMWSTVFG